MLTGSGVLKHSRETSRTHEKIRKGNDKQNEAFIGLPWRHAAKDGQSLLLLTKFVAHSTHIYINLAHRSITNRFRDTKISISTWHYTFIWSSKCSSGSGNENGYYRELVVSSLHPIVIGSRSLDWSKLTSENTLLLVILFSPINMLHFCQKPAEQLAIFISSQPRISARHWSFWFLIL